jgi:hypothetical protein
MVFERFRQPEKGLLALKHHLDCGRPIGLQTSVFWLPYFPEDMRFHFNAHNLVVYGYRDDNFLISDPTFEQKVVADSKSLQQARFAKGMLAPKGLLYYPKTIPENIDFCPIITLSIKKTCRMMLSTPLPIIGIRGIRHIAKKLAALSVDAPNNKIFIGHIVRMQEEIGTGGAGFRFLYASFLQESALLLDNSNLQKSSEEFTDTGDEWRRFALYCAKMLKGRMDLNYVKLSQQLHHVADCEQQSFKNLQTAIS